jgi:hypothetical protein
VFLYSEYLHPAVEVYKDTSDLKEVEKVIQNRANKLSNKEFKRLLNEMIINLYVHSTSKDDIQKTAT